MTVKKFLDRSWYCHDKTVVMLSMSCSTVERIIDWHSAFLFLQDDMSKPGQPGARPAGAPAPVRP